MNINASLAVAVLYVGLSNTALAETAAIEVNPSRNAYYGDLHLHTSFSFDAYFFFASKITPDQAYKFAQGQPVPFLDHTVQRQWPLDFLAVTDHSENLGVFNQLDDPDSALSKTDTGKEIRGLPHSPHTFFQVFKYFVGGKPIAGFDPKPAMASAWQTEVAAANANYKPGKFTTFAAYEWSSMPSGKYNLHRNVFFKGEAAPAPFSSNDSNKPEDLWTYLEDNRKNGIEALSISHNGNASNGLMYDWKDSYGRLIDEVYAERRALNEPLTEISQGKGQSETIPALSPNDEFSNFEVYDMLLDHSQKSDPHGSYVRDAYGRGLVIQQQVGVNPFKFGVVGASDFHDGLSTSNEGAFAGGVAGIDPLHDLPTVEEAKLALAPPAPIVNKTPPDPGFSVEGEIPTVLFGSGNITGVWSESNTRESIYAALRRKETFATSGSRLKFRFFGGWAFGDGLQKQGDWIKTAYEKGVPMGGDLPAKPADAHAPRFAIWAVKDPDGANLDRVQIIKVWLKDGRYDEKVFDVALSDGRKADLKTGKGPALASTVDLKTASYRNSIGATELATVWKDPQFDAGEAAVYYLRVIEIPTPRWSTILAVKEGLPIPDGVPATIQERGWSSPIWYTPAKAS